MAITNTQECVFSSARSHQLSLFLKTGGSARRERGRVAACEFGGGNRRTADQLLEGVGHAVVAVVAMQLGHGDQVCDQMRRQLSLLELGFPDLWRHVDVLDGAAQSAAELLRELGPRQRLGAGQFVELARMRFWVV